MSTGLESSQWGLYNKELESRGIEDISRDELFFTESELEFGKKMFEHKSWDNFCGDTFDSIFESYLEDYNLLKDLASLDLPILNIFGDRDLRFSKTVTTSFKQYNKNIEDLEIKNSGHFPFLINSNRDLIVSKIVGLGS